MESFNYRVVTWKCDCGTAPLRVGTAITSEGELAALWYCTKCKKQVMAVIPIRDLIDQIPPSPDKTSFTPQDQLYLKEMHIQLE